MAGGPLPKRVTCPKCRAPEGIGCRDPEDHRQVAPHLDRRLSAERWYVRPSPDGLTPKRRDEMVEGLREIRDRRDFINANMLKISEAEDSEAEYERITKGYEMSR